MSVSRRFFQPVSTHGWRWILAGALLGMLLVAIGVPARAAGLSNPALQMSDALKKPAPPPSQPVLSPQDAQALERMLKDPKTRAALIAALQQLASGQVSAAGRTQSASAASAPAKGFSDTVMTAVNGLITRSTDTLGALQSLAHALTSSPGAAANWRQIGRFSWPLALIIVLAYLVIWGVRLLLSRPLDRLADWARRGTRQAGLSRGLLVLLIDGAAGALAIAAAWGVSATTSSVLVRHDAMLRPLFVDWLQALLVVEGLRLGVYLLLGRRLSLIALLARDSDLAHRFRLSLSRLILLVGYGMLLIVPIIARTVGASLAHALTWLIGVLAYVLLLRLVIKRHDALTHALASVAQRRKGSFSGWLLQVLARTWLILVVAYLTLILGALLLRPGDVLPFIGRASVWSLVTVLAALVAFKLINHWLGMRVRLAEGVTARLPALERRVNQLLPLMRRSLNAVVATVAVLALLYIWHVSDGLVWLRGPTGQLVLDRLVTALVIAALTLVAWVVIDSVIEARLEPDGDRAPSARATTLLGLFRVVLGILLGVIGGMMVLSALGVNIGPLLAGAGVLGLAVGFGSQKLVQDIINGIFIQIENAINVGDFIKIGNISGTAELVTIRSVRLRDMYGIYHIIPYSSVNEVSNYSHGYANCVCVYGIAYREDIDAATAKLQEAFEDLMTEEAVKDKILEPMVVQGVVGLNSSSVDIRVSIKVLPGNQWAVERALNRLVKIHFDRAGIEFPFTQQTIWFGEDKSGNAPPARLRIEQPSGTDSKSR